MYTPAQRETASRPGSRLVAGAGRMLHSLWPTPAKARIEAPLDELRKTPATRVIGEREVSVLFADLRGYSRYAERHRPAEIFSLLEAYADCASKIVRRHGGRVLSFHGDGLLAVFDQPDKELSALAAARALILSLDELGEVPCRPAPEDLPIGIGIATGMAFLGCIGRGLGATWSAAGDVTNVAARLQELSRTYRSPILMDRSTFERVATPCATHLDVDIRGREAHIDIFTPLSAPRPVGRGDFAPVGVGSEAETQPPREAPAGAPG
jgi:class 3 adenylate cyclase